jgi:protein required for attachment to host cells
MTSQHRNGDTRAAHWICLADTRTCRLLRATRTGNGRWHLDEIDTLANQWEDDKEHGRPNALARVSERAGAPSFAGRGHQQEEGRRRFARDAAAWIAARLGRHEIDRLELFAAPSMVGELRHAADRRTRSLAREHEADLNSIPIGDLARHPAIEGVLGARSDARADARVPR